MRVAFQEGFMRTGGRNRNCPSFSLSQPKGPTPFSWFFDPWTGLPLSPQVAKYQFRSARNVGANIWSKSQLVGLLLSVTLLCLGVQ
jgi:hypothetical protein